MHPRRQYRFLKPRPRCARGPPARPASSALPEGVKPPAPWEWRGQRAFPLKPAALRTAGQNAPPRRSEQTPVPHCPQARFPRSKARPGFRSLRQSLRKQERKAPPGGTARMQTPPGRCPPRGWRKAVRYSTRQNREIFPLNFGPGRRAAAASPSCRPRQGHSGGRFSHPWSGKNPPGNLPRSPAREPPPAAVRPPPGCPARCGTPRRTPPGLLKISRWF
ncbi:hypothetical protein SDC9_78691 [bioreactor metagenome]|uniref:Uncharacterized protein n=1 Tax=bioreactor metagenome TaxID=1076179 RepID=A0A644YU95_9ZZZZ